MQVQNEKFPCLPPGSPYLVGPMVVGLPQHALHHKTRIDHNKYVKRYIYTVYDLLASAKQKNKQIMKEITTSD